MIIYLHNIYFLTQSTGIYLFLQVEMELIVNPSLSLFLFRVDADISSPYIAVRQIDCAILRSEDKAKNKRRVSTEQAQRYVAFRK